MHGRLTKQLIILGFLAMIIFIPGLLAAQQIIPDTLRLTIPKAEELFLLNNLTLVANQYNVDINKALVQQSKVWDNPVLNTDQNIYDGKFFRHKTEKGQQYGQVYLQVQQLIRTAGKIKKHTQLMQDNVLSAEAQFNEVMRNLKYVLTTDLNNLNQLQNTATVYLNEIQIMETLVNGMDEMYKIGDISLKENIRIKALFFSLKSDYNDNLRQQYDLQKEISTSLMLNDNVWVIADAGQSLTEKQITTMSLANLQDSAFNSRPDLYFAKSQSLFEKHNIDYQKALAKPDFSVGIEYDKLNSYIPNYYGLAVSFPLNLFNKNKGNIAAAQFAYQQNDAAVKQMHNQVGKEVWSAWQKLITTTSLLNNDNTLLKTNYEGLMKSMVNSYRQRQVSLIEFVDFIDAYKDTRIKLGLQVTNQRNAAAELNYTTNQNLIKL